MSRIWNDNCREKIVYLPVPPKWEVSTHFAGSLHDYVIHDYYDIDIDYDQGTLTASHNMLYPWLLQFLAKLTLWHVEQDGTAESGLWGPAFSEIWKLNHIRWIKRSAWQCQALAQWQAQIFNRHLVDWQPKLLWLDVGTPDLCLYADDSTKKFRRTLTVPTDVNLFSEQTRHSMIPRYLLWGEGLASNTDRIEDSLWSWRMKETNCPILLASNLVNYSVAKCNTKCI